MRLARWAVFWMALLALSAAPALAQVVVSGDNNNATQYVDCS